MEKLIKKDMIDPVTEDKLSEKDIIFLQRVCVFCPVWKLNKSLETYGDQCVGPSSAVCGHVQSALLTIQNLFSA